MLQSNKSEYKSILPDDSNGDGDLLTDKEIKTSIPKYGVNQGDNRSYKTGPFLILKPMETVLTKKIRMRAASMSKRNKKMWSR